MTFSRSGFPAFLNTAFVHNGYHRDETLRGELQWNKTEH